MASQNGHRDVVQTLLGAGADVNIARSYVSDVVVERCDGMWTILVWCCELLHFILTVPIIIVHITCMNSRKELHKYMYITHVHVHVWSSGLEHTPGHSSEEGSQGNN